MLRYMQNSEPKDNRKNVTNNPVTNDVAQGDSPRLPPSQSGTQLSSRTIHESLPLSARQQLAEAAKIPVPTPIRGKTPSYHTSGAVTTSSSSPKQIGQQQGKEQRQLYPHSRAQRQPLQQTRSDPVNNRLPLYVSELSQEHQQKQQQIWEESSINSMFADSDATTTQQPPQRAVDGDRYDSPILQQRAQERGRDSPAASLIRGDWGVPRIPLVNGNDNLAGRIDDPYVERSHNGSPSRHKPVLEGSQYALRETREAARRSSFSEKQFFTKLNDIEAASPEPCLHHRSESIPALGRPALVGGGIGPKQDLHNKRLVYSHDIDEPLGRTPSRQDADEGSDLAYHVEEAVNQRTLLRGRSSSPHSELQQPKAVSRKRVLQHHSLPHVGGDEGNRRGKQIGRKRRQSLDYDDSLLHSMNYSELRDEPFDHDPTRVAVRAQAVPANLSMEDRLIHFQSKDANSQEQFFTEMPMQEWDECGDWFLSQFAELSNKIREKRQAKRRRMADFEAEISEREKTVRLKAESIERTLGDLRHEGEGMMRGKVVDL
ncbi:hypothetical protein SEPCBS57363_000033 [Sporothrix epigloea]|uniref:Extracellular mutant protein 11 C-terminal domain-containing protein n=1 Tax=Sporothrix epigloea TaxID=1892477 RepID=A0ABP0D2J2_9PEZI